MWDSGSGDFRVLNPRVGCLGSGWLAVLDAASSWPVVVLLAP